MGPNFRSPGAMAGNAIEQFFLERELMERDRMEQEFRRKQEEARMAQAAQQLQLQQQQEQRIAAAQQMQMERVATQDRQAQNTLGVQRMMGERISQGPMTSQDAQSIEGMAVSEGLPVPGIVDRARMPPKPPTQFTLNEGDVRYDESGAVVARGPAKRPAAVSPELEESRRLANENRQLDIDRKRAKDEEDAKWRERTGEDAQRVTQTAYELATRLETHPGRAKAQGAYEMRGFTQDAKNYKGIRTQLVAALALPNLGALKGPMSDKDIMFVKNLATRLENDNLSDDEALLAIQEAKRFLESKGATTSTGGGMSARDLIEKYRAK